MVAFSQISKILRDIANVRKALERIEGKIDALQKKEGSQKASKG